MLAVLKSKAETAICPMLWLTAPKILSKTKLKDLYLFKVAITITEKTPPARLKSPAIGPLLKKTKTDFKMDIKSALFAFMKNRQYIVTIFDNPSFIPGGIEGRAGISPSTKLKTHARHKSIPMLVIFLTSIFSVFPFFR